MCYQNLIGSRFFVAQGILKLIISNENKLKFKNLQLIGVHEFNFFGRFDLKKYAIYKAKVQKLCVTKRAKHVN